MFHSGKKTHVATLELTVCVRAGFVQTPRWDGRVYYPHNMNSKVLVLVPSHHSVMLSFQSFNVGTLHECQDDYLKLSTERSSSKRIGLNLDWLCDDSFLSFPKVYNTTALHFMFVSDDVIQHEGFRAIFSFHNISASPKKSDGGLWNCSVPYWPDFRHHFPCNLQSDCVNSEDEVFDNHLFLCLCTRWGTTDNFTTSFLHFSLFSAGLWNLANSRPVHFLMLSAHIFLCLSCLLPLFIMPCKTVFARPDERAT